MRGTGRLVDHHEKGGCNGSERKGRWRMQWSKRKGTERGHLTDCCEEGCNGEEATGGKAASCERNVVRGKEREYAADGRNKREERQRLVVRGRGEGRCSDEGGRREEGESCGQQGGCIEATVPRGRGKRGRREKDEDRGQK